MSFEDIEIKKTNEREFLYPERAFLRVHSEIDRLKKIQSGEIRRIELTEEEKSEVLEFENKLGEKLEKNYEYNDKFCNILS
ncbi:MAG TPA: hypothetical protein PLF30_03760 [Candidatus Moranbacteria bacterium]|jgi:hypothetical protein|nr:hypothetical protein [Candidatus Moranbacteria bacterium]HPX94643.1 hypothetical protein [Candidatus Moranbacteria bacterium]HQB59850.1 hypothetical protein [Candidatus Moranbacteria bacterium]